MLLLTPLFIGLFTAVLVNNLSVTLRRAQLVGKSGSMAATSPQKAPVSSLLECINFCLLFITRRQLFHLPQQRRSAASVFVALLLLLAGVESNPGPIAASLKLGVFNVQSAVHKASLLHDVIADYCIDLLVVTETWMKATHPAAVTQDIAPAGFRVIHSFRKDEINGGGVAFVYADILQVSEVQISSSITSVDCLVTKVRTRRGRLNIAAFYRPPSSSRCAVSVGQFCDQLGILLDELLALPGHLVICGDFNCPADTETGVDARLLETFSSHNLTQRVDRPTHRNGGTLDLLAHLEGSVIASDIEIIDAGFSDHRLLTTVISTQLPQPDLIRYAFRNIRQIDLSEFSARLRRSDVYVRPLNDVDGFTHQLKQCVTEVLDVLAPLKTRTKRRGKADCRCLSDAAISAKQTRRHLERKWKRTGSEADRVEYRVACRAANAAINSSRATFYNERLTEAAGDQKTMWRISKELLHSDDRPLDTSPREAKLLCDGFSEFFIEKLRTISTTISTRLQSIAVYHLPPTRRNLPLQMDTLAEVTVEEVSRLIGVLPPKTSALDFMPISLLKSSVNVMAPLITRLANLSFSSGTFPSTLKHGRVTPLLKKPGMDKSVVANHRPITNLSTLSKLLERLVLSRLRPHVLSSGNFSEFQSAYRAGHSTETALLRVQNDLILNIEKQKTTALLALDISAAFDTIDFATLSDRLRTDFGIGGFALDWLRSFLIGRTQYVGVGSARSTPVMCMSGVPQGSVLGPLLFAIYISPVDNIVAAHRVCLHQYADDTQLYVALRPTDISPYDVVSHCVSDVSRWFLENGMLLNPSKTEAVLFGTRAQRKKINTSSGIDVAGTQVPLSSSVKLLGVTLDEDLSLDRHVSDIVRGCCYHTRALRHIRPLIDLPVARMVAQGVVTSRLDYCNGLLHGTSARNMERLQVAQNSLARAVCQATWSSSATELRRSLHWLPVKQRVDYKLAVIAYKTRSTGVPSYLSSLIEDYVPSRSLRSSDQMLLSAPCVKLVCSRKAFSVSAPMIWNSLSYNCRSAQSLSSFKRLLKTDLFYIAYKNSPPI
jgi:exonuclease III